MYTVLLQAIDPTSKPGESKPGKFPTTEDADQARDDFKEALGALPGKMGEPQAIDQEGAIGMHGDAALPHADAVVSAAHALFRALAGEPKAPRLLLSGYIVDQRGVTAITTPAIPSAAAAAA